MRGGLLWLGRSVWMFIATSARSRSRRPGTVRSAGRIETGPRRLSCLRPSLLPTDVVALEVTGNAGEIARILEPHVARVVVVSPHDTGISPARAKIDRLDAVRWPSCWPPVSSTRCRYPTNGRARCGGGLARRDQLVCARTRAKNEIHAVLDPPAAGPPRRGSPTCSACRARWLSELELPATSATDRRRLRHIDFLDPEVGALDRAIAREALRWPEMLRLMTVPGVSVIPRHVSRGDRRHPSLPQRP